MEEVKIDVQIRSEVGSQKVKDLRRTGDVIPGIVYGGGQEPTPVQVDRRTYERVRRQHHGEVLFHLNVKEGEKSVRDYSAIVKEEQHDYVTDQIIHVDFKRISLKEKIEVRVPLAPKGEPIGVKRDKGSLEHILWELDIVCLPMDIPEQIEVDVAALEIGQVICVSNIQLPKGVETKHDPEAIVFSVTPPRREEETPAAVEPGAEPEVIKKEKAKADEGEGKAEGGGK